jgi:transposase
MQENAPCHKARSVLAFFEEKNIQSLNWPAFSPALNPIDNLWAWIKKKHESEYSYPIKKDQLIDNIMEIWVKVYSLQPVCQCS